MAKLYYMTKNRYKPGKGIENTMPSETVQGEVRSLEEQLERYRRTGEISRHDVDFVDVDDVDTIDEYFRSNVDLTDLDTLKERTKNLQQIIEEKEAENVSTSTKSNKTVDGGEDGQNDKKSEDNTKDE